MTEALPIQAGAAPEVEPSFEKVLTFRVAEETYAVGVEVVSEIISMQRIIHVPDVPDFIRGVINLRGTVVPVMDVRTRFGLEARAYDERTCIIVIRSAGASVGLVVDTIAEVVDIPLDQIEVSVRQAAATDQASTGTVRALGKVDGSVKIMLDVEALLQRDAAHSDPPSTRQPA